MEVALLHAEVRVVDETILQPGVVPRTLDAQAFGYRAVVLVAVLIIMPTRNSVKEEGRPESHHLCKRRNVSDDLNRGGEKGVRCTNASRGGFSESAGTRARSTLYSSMRAKMEPKFCATVRS